MAADGSDQGRSRHITALRGQYSSDIPTFAAGVLIAAVPLLLVYLVFQRQITEGVTAGSTKG